jgi:hypothetical protein
MDRDSVAYAAADYRAPSLEQGPGWRSEGGLQDAINGIRAREPWSLRIDLRLTHSTGEKSVFVRFVWDGEPEPPTAARFAADHASARGEIVQALVKVPLNPLLTPLLERR